MKDHLIENTIISIPFILSAIFYICDIVGIINWSFIWIISPIWIFILLDAVVYGLLTLFIWIFEWKQK